MCENAFWLVLCSVIFFVDFQRESSGFTRFPVWRTWNFRHVRVFLIRPPCHTSDATFHAPFSLNLNFLVLFSSNNITNFLTELELFPTRKSVENDVRRSNTFDGKQNSRFSLLVTKKLETKKRIERTRIEQIIATTCRTRKMDRWKCRCRISWVIPLQ